MSAKLTAPRGTADILPEQIPLWNKVERTAREILTLYGYKEIRTPFFEDTDLFARSMGQTSDVVQKQMLQLQSQKRGDADDMEKTHLALRPEGTASVVRSYIENSLDKKEGISKLFYVGPMFRGERPQKGRLRQFHQIGVEVLGAGAYSPYLDAEVIALSVNILKALGLEGFKVRYNTLGSPQDKEAFAGFLREHLAKDQDKLCEDCRNRFERNVFRILDCKNRTCREVVSRLDLKGASYLSEAGRLHFKSVRDALAQLNIDDICAQDPYLVRGLDYYTHTVFEISSPNLGSQDALGAGGRYNNLVSQLGGPEVGAVGFALGMERILLALPKNEAKTDGMDLFVLPVGDEISLARAFAYLDNVRTAVQAEKSRRGIRRDFVIDMGYRAGASFKSLMREANDKGARFVAILGENEIKQGVVALKDMATGAQENIPLAEVSLITQKLLEGIH